MNEEKLAWELYETYCAAVGGKAFNGDALPGWEIFRADPGKKVQSAAWVEVARAAIRACGRDRIDVQEQPPVEQMKTVQRWRQALRSKLAS